MSAAPKTLPHSHAPAPQLWQTRPRLPLRKTSNSLKVHFFAVSLCALSWAVLPPITSLIFNGCIVTVTYLWLGVTETRRGPLWLTPLSLFFFFYGVEMGPATLYVAYGFQSNPWLPFATTLIPAKDVAAGYVISLLGMLAMHVGLETLRPRPTWNTQPKCLSRFPFLRFGILLLLAVISIYQPQFVLPFGMFAIIFQYGGLAALLPLAFSTSRQLGISRAAHGALIVLGTCGLLAAGVASQNSSKMEVVLALLPLGALLAQNRNFRKWLPFAAAPAFYVYLVLLAPAINASRAIPTVRGLTTWDKVVQSAQVNSILAYRETPWVLLSEQYENFMMRMFEPPSVTGFMVGDVARSGLQMGNTMRELGYAFIPRIIWPEKPIVSRGTWFTTYLGMAPRPEEATTSTGMTAFGEWYWNFGIFGEITGMFLIGFLLSGLWRLVGSYPIFEPFRMLLYSAILVNAVMLPEASSVLVTMAALYILFGGSVFLRRIVDTRAIRQRVNYFSTWAPIGAQIRQRTSSDQRNIAQGINP